MLLRALVLSMATVSVHVAAPGLCPEGRTLERQLEAADVVAFGKVRHDFDCPPFEGHSEDSVRWQLPGCLGQMADFVIERTWKGPASPGQGLMLHITDTTGLQVRKGEKHVVFARLAGTAEAPTWIARTDACMLPDGAKSSNRSLKHQLDRWFKSRQGRDDR